MVRSLGSGGSGSDATGPTSKVSAFENLYDLLTYSSTSKPAPARKQVNAI